MSFTVATYNVLADSYLRPDFYPRTPAHVLARARRGPALLDRVQSLEADVLCLQEVEPDRLAALRDRLTLAHAYARKTLGKPDGCATFHRGSALWSETLDYADGTGHVALLVGLEVEGRRLGVANTHLRWDDEKEDGPGAAQLARLLERTATLDCHGWIVCGDFNARLDSPALQRSLEAGWRDACALRPACTCNAKGRASRIDFLLHTPGLTPFPLPVPGVEDLTPLPSEQEPSDHVPVAVRFEWA